MYILRVRVRVRGAYLLNGKDKTHVKGVGCADSLHPQRLVEQRHDKFPSGQFLYGPVAHCAETGALGDIIIVASV